MNVAAAVLAGGQVQDRPGGTERPAERRQQQPGHVDHGPDHREEGSIGGDWDAEGDEDHHGQGSGGGAAAKVGV